MNHDIIEKNVGLMAVLIIIAISIAGLVEIVPLFSLESTTKPIAGLKPLNALQLEGRDIYIREGCHVCHTQMIRPLRAETERYGHYSVAGESVYNHPFLWGSKRTGPDLHRVGNYRTTDWHENHMKDPAAVVPGSIMPKYTWLYTNLADIDTAYAEQLTDAQFFAVPYNKPVPMKDGSTKVVKMGNSVAEANAMALAEAKVVAADMKDQDVKDKVANGEIPEIVALIAYLNSLK